MKKLENIKSTAKVQQPEKYNAIIKATKREYKTKDAIHNLFMVDNKLNFLFYFEIATIKKRIVNEDGKRLEL